jgi:predicted O-methyltransferase YrrM
MDINFVKDYIKHRLTAKSRHKVHSPFINRLFNDVIFDKSQKQVYADMEQKKRASLLPNSRRKGNRPKADQLLYRLAKHFKPKRVVEIGTGMGISKMYLTRAQPNSHITSFEVDGSLKHATAKLKHVDLVFINYYEPAQLLNIFEMLLPKLQTNSVLVMYNVYASAIAKQNFQIIKLHPRVTVTVDLFWLQLVFFREDMVNEHFRLRF